MKIYVTVLAMVIGLALGLVDEDLNARYLTMERSNFIDYFNGQNYTWKRTQYRRNFHFNFGLQKPIEFDRRPYYTGPMIYRHPNTLSVPIIFDARQHWSRCTSIREVYNQYSCNSCWAHGVANTASDRICIHLNKEVHLSEQDLECSLGPGGSICQPGIPVAGFHFWKNRGLVTSDCKAYKPLENLTGCRLSCTASPFKNYHQDKHYAETVYPVPNTSFQIKAELYVNGPIQATMPIYEDFNDAYGHGYHSGIYVHKYGKYLYNHSVRIIGFGVENGVEYWLAANTWGREWGENGCFRIKSFQPDIRLEESLYTGLPRR